MEYYLDGKVGDFITRLMSSHPLFLKASSSASSSGSKIIDHFVGMGFSEKLVAKVIEEHGIGSISFHLETVSIVKLHLVTCSVESSRRGEYRHYFGDAPHICSKLLIIPSSHMISLNSLS